MQNSVLIRSLLVATILGLGLWGQAWGEDMLKVGDAAPEFSAKDFDGNSVVLSELTGNGPVVLVFLRGFG